MPNSKIANLIDGDPAQTSDELLANRGGLDRKLTAGSVAALGQTPWLQDIDANGFELFFDNNDGLHWGGAALSARDLVTVQDALFQGDTDFVGVLVTNETGNASLNVASADFLHYYNLQSNGTTGNADFFGSDGVRMFAGDGSGSGTFAFYPSGGANAVEKLDLTLRSIAFAVNSLEVVNAPTGSGPVVGAIGSDTDIDLNFTPKGSGLVKFGTHTGLGGETVTGYITVKDSGGTPRKLAVVS